MVTKFIPIFVALLWIFYIHFYWFFTCTQKQVWLASYLDNCAYKSIDKRMAVYLGENPFETDYN